MAALGCRGDREPMRRLTVLSVAYPLAPVGPDAVGGSEQVLTALDSALVAAGHRSIVLAHEGSSARGELVTYAAPPEGEPIDEAIASAQRERVHDAMLRLLQRTHVDLVHMHGLDFHFYLPPPGPPVLATLHLPPDWYPKRQNRAPRSRRSSPRSSASKAARSARPAVPERSPPPARVRTASRTNKPSQNRR